VLSLSTVNTGTCGAHGGMSNRAFEGAAQPEPKPSTSSAATLYQHPQATTRPVTHNPVFLSPIPPPASAATEPVCSRHSNKTARQQHSKGSCAYVQSAEGAISLPPPTSCCQSLALPQQYSRHTQAATSRLGCGALPVISMHRLGLHPRRRRPGATRC
jgi:hypothetical protein